MGSYNIADELGGLSDEQIGTKLHEKGDYVFVVTAAEENETSGHNPCIRLKVEFVDGQYRGNQLTKDVIYSNRTDAGKAFFFKQMNWLGISPDLIKARRLDLAAAALLLPNTQFVGKIDHREFPKDSGEYRLDLNIKSLVSNPNVGGVEAPSAEDLPPAEEWNDDDVPSAAPAAVASGAGVATDADDPWGAGTK